jgi:hypothetical protein
MTAVKKIDSNGTGLRFAIENPDGTLPASPTWFPLEPNSYDKFGGAIKTVARNPINDSRQRKKGVVVDLDANAGFEMDVTSDNLTRLMQGFLFAATRTKAELSATVVGLRCDDYQPAAGGDSYYAGNLLFAKNYSQAANNGLKTVTGTPSATSVPVLPPRWPTRTQLVASSAVLVTSLVLALPPSTFPARCPSWLSPASLQRPTPSP